MPRRNGPVEVDPPDEQRAIDSAEAARYNRDDNNQTMFPEQGRNGKGGGHTQTGSSDLEPEVTLFANGTADSRKALQALAQAEVGVRVVPELHRKVPGAIWAQATFEGLPEIQQLASTLRRVQGTVREKLQQLPETYGQRDPAYAAQVKARRAQLLAEAWAELERLQAAGKQEGGSARR